MTALELLEKKINSFDAWLEDQKSKVKACEERIQSDMEMIESIGSTVDDKTEEMQFFRDLYAAMKEDLRAKKTAAEAYVGGIDDAEESAKAKSFCSALGIELEDEADENAAEDDEGREEDAEGVVQHDRTGT